MFQDNYEQLFINELSNGIILFVGAGFSRLPDINGECFPDAKELCQDICREFSIDEIFSDDLYAASEMVPKNEYQNYLRERFHVKNEINPKYKLIDKLNIKSIITTNIDDIIKTIFKDDNTQHYINDTNSYGSVRKNKFGIEYIALNGDVSIKDSYLYFGKFDLSVVENRNGELYNIARYRFNDNPILFWGYSFADTGVQRMVKYLLDNNKHSRIWVQCLESDTKQIKFFTALGCKVIIADTDEMFEWLENKYLPLTTRESENLQFLSNKEFDRYRIPKPYSIETYEKEDYYRLGVTNWFSIYNNHAYETNLVDEIWALSLTNKNLIILGSQFAGKTTSLMQCAVKRNGSNVFYFLGDTTKEEAEFFLKLINSEKIVVFLQDAHKDVETLCCFASAENVRLIATADEYLFDNIKHILSRKDIKYHGKFIENIDKDTARQIYNHIPENIVRPRFTYRENENERYSFFELLGQNVKDFATYDSVLQVLNNIYYYDSDDECYGDEIQLVALTIYLEQHDSLMSTDLFFSFFNFVDYFDEIVPLTKKVKDLLNDATDVSVDQDYFSIRSKFFLKHAHKAFTTDSELKNVYKAVITKFITQVYKRNVFRYDTFKRKAYDSHLFYKIFFDDSMNNDLNECGKEGIELYDVLYNYDDSPYTLQQKALYLSLLHRSKEAFAVIDEALTMFPNNLSMKNSKAEIIFNANKSFNTVQAETQLIKAINILEECQKNDKKQNYHAILYAKIVLHLNKFFNGDNSAYIAPAIEWLSSIDSNDATINKLLVKLKQLSIN